MTSLWSYTVHYKPVFIEVESIPCGVDGRFEVDYHLQSQSKAYKGVCVLAVGKESSLPYSKDVEGSLNPERLKYHLRMWVLIQEPRAGI